MNAIEVFPDREPVKSYHLIQFVHVRYPND